MTNEGIFISSALAANWLPWVCLIMVGLIWLSCMMQPQYLRGLLSNSFSTFGINSAEQKPSLGSQISQWVFNMTVPAIAVYCLVVQDVEYGTDLLTRIFLLAVAIDIARTLVAWLVQYTFRFGKMFGLMYLNYFSLRSLFTLVLLCEVLLVICSDQPAAWSVLMIITLVLFLVVLGVQWGRMICSSPLDILSIILYILTVEFLLMILLYAAAEQMYLE